MKFLCVSCDEPMKLQTVGDGGAGSLSVVYGCPRCDHRIAMLTNPLETEMVRSLGVRIGPGSGDAEAAEPTGAARETATGTEAPAGGSGCPFSGMVAQMEAEATADGPRWTPEALSRLDNIPEFVRPMAKQGIEHYARTEGLATIDEEVLERARGRFGM